MKINEAYKNNNQSDIVNTIQWLIDRAINQHKKNNLEEAIADYLKVIELEPKQPSWLYENVIILLAKLERFTEGKPIAERALVMHLESNEIYRALGVFYEHQNSINCIEQYQKAIALNPEQPDWLYCNLAKQLLQYEQLEESIIVASQGIKLYPNFHFLYYVLGNALTKKEKWNESIAAYRRVQELDPNWLEIEEKLKFAVFQKNKLERYTEISRRAEEFHQNNTASKIATLGREQFELTRQTIKTTTEANNSIDFEDFELENIDSNWLFDKLRNNKIGLSDCQKLWQNQSTYSLTLDYGCWLSPSILYLEASVDRCWVFNEVEILACSQHKYAVTKANFFQISNTQVAGVACFNRDLYVESFENYQICINYHQTLVSVIGAITQKAYSLEFIKNLKEKPEYQKHLVFSQRKFLQICYKFDFRKAKTRS